MKYPVFDERVDLVNRDDLGHYSTQPDDLNDENCLHIYPTFNLKWVDGQCDDEHFYICEREVA